jgi:hypothetical protein
MTRIARAKILYKRQKQFRLYPDNARQAMFRCKPDGLDALPKPATLRASFGF